MKLFRSIWHCITPWFRSDCVSTIESDSPRFESTYAIGEKTEVSST